MSDCRHAPRRLISPGWEVVFRDRAPCDKSTPSRGRATSAWCARPHHTVDNTWHPPRSLRRVHAGGGCRFVMETNR